MMLTRNDSQNTLPQRRSVSANLQRPAEALRSGNVCFVVGASILAIALIGASETSELRTVGDSEITSAVQRALATDRAVSKHVEVETRDGVVSLKGNVCSLRAVHRARRIAETVKGVRAVVNRLKVLTESRKDEALRRDVEKALREDPAVAQADVSVSVDNGSVALQGVVDSWAVKRICGQVVAGVRGVRDLANGLEIHRARPRDDDQLAAEIKRRLAMDVWTDDAQVRVEVKDGGVTLSGLVGSAAQKSRIENVALLCGAHSVDLEAVEVSPKKHLEMRRQAAPSGVSDEVIAEAVRDALRVDPRVARDGVTVQVTEGVVRLSGHVATLRAKFSAERDAYNTIGVWEVKNDLRVRRGETADADEVLSRRVQEALLREPDVDPADVNVSVREGRVVLYGAVDSNFEKEQAKDAAGSIRGVVEVSAEGLTTDEKPIVEDDDQIAARIRDELWWNPLVDGDRIEFSVEDGAVTLTGTVSDSHERNLATGEAYEGGARIVYNKLKLMSQEESR